MLKKPVFIPIPSFHSPTSRSSPGLKTLIKSRTRRMIKWIYYFFLVNFFFWTCLVRFMWSFHGFQNRTGPRGRIVKTENWDENWFFKPKELDFLLILWTVKTGVGPQLPMRTMRSNPLANFFFLIKKQLNTILFYLIKLSISYKE